MADMANRSASTDALQRAAALKPSGTADSGTGLLAVLATLAALSTLATNILLPSLPSIASDFGLSTPETGPTLSAFFAAFAVGQLLVGPLSDRFGRRPVVLGGLAIFIAGSVWCALAPTFPLLVGGRVIQALGACAASVLSRAIARDLFSGAALARLLAAIMVAMAAAPGFSPLLGGALDYAFGWRSAFVALAVVGLTVAAAYAWRVGETHHTGRVAIDPASIARGYVGLATDRRFIVPAGTVALIMGGLFAVFTASPAVLVDGLGFSALGLGLFFAGTVFVVFAAGMLAPRLAARFEPARVTALGLAGANAGGAMLLALAGLGVHAFPAYLAPISIFLFGMGLLNPLATAMTLSPFGDRAGLAAAFLGFLQMAAAALSVVAVTSMPVAPALALGIVLAATSAAALLLFLKRA